MVRLLIDNLGGIMHLPKILVLLILSFCFTQAMLSCQDSGFEGSAPRSDIKATPTPTPTTAAATPATPAVPPPTPTPVESPKTDCLSGDFVNFTYPPQIENCINQGKLYYFENGNCSAIDKAPFACSFENVESSWTSVGGDPALFKDFKEKNAKLVGCGQSKDGETTVAQWYFPPKNQQINCQFSTTGMTIYTYCIKRYSVGSIPNSTSATPDQVKQMILDCMMDQ